MEFISPDVLNTINFVTTLGHKVNLQEIPRNQHRTKWIIKEFLLDMWPHRWWRTSNMMNSIFCHWLALSQCYSTVLAQHKGYNIPVCFPFLVAQLSGWKWSIQFHTVPESLDVAASFVCLSWPPSFCFAVFHDRPKLLHTEREFIGNCPCLKLFLHTKWCSPFLHCLKDTVDLIQIQKASKLLLVTL